MEEMNEIAKEVFRKIDELDVDARNHLRKTLMLVFECYINPEAKGVLVFSEPNRPNVLYGLNCHEMESTQMLQDACEVMSDYNMQDAPDKENMN
jgi:hypothetical protein